METVGDTNNLSADDEVGAVIAEASVRNAAADAKIDANPSELGIVKQTAGKEFMVAGQPCGGPIRVKE